MSSRTDDSVIIPINGILDLYTFRPCEVGDVVEEYLIECHKMNTLQVRLIHGKGIGNLRRTVEARLQHLSIVESWQPAGHDAGHWGATIVTLK